jgi:hypothetical protein
MNIETLRDHVKIIVAAVQQKDYSVFLSSLWDENDLEIDRPQQSTSMKYPEGMQEQPYTKC